MVNDVNGYRDEYMQNLRSELLRLRSLPYTHKRQEQINKLKTVIEMNQNYQYHAEQFYKLVDDIYRNGIK